MLSNSGLDFLDVTTEARDIVYMANQEFDKSLEDVTRDYWEGRGRRNEISGNKGLLASIQVLGSSLADGNVDESPLII